MQQRLRGYVQRVEFGRRAQAGAGAGVRPSGRQGAGAGVRPRRDRVRELVRRPAGADAAQARGCDALFSA